MLEREMRTDNALQVKRLHKDFSNCLIASPPWRNLLLTKYIYICVMCKLYTNLHNMQLTKTKYK